MKWAAVSITLSAMLILALAQKPLTYEQRKELVNAHNHYRRVAVNQFGASNMKIMEWNDDLESFAYEHIKDCKLELSSKESRSQGIAGEPYIGENLWGSTDEDLRNLSVAVKAFYSEQEHYKYLTNECIDNKPCGNFTQLVWGNSYKVGCAVTSKGQCSGQTPPTIVACNYAPGGNIEGEKPYEVVKDSPIKEPPKVEDGCKTCKGAFTAFCLGGLCSKVANADSLVLPDPPTKAPSKTTKKAQT